MEEKNYYRIYLWNISNAIVTEGISEDEEEELFN